MLTSMMFSVCQQLLEKLSPVRFHCLKCGCADVARVMSGLLETKGIQCAKAALPDDAGIELSYWALPGETPEQAAARVRILNLAHKWWICNLETEAYGWLHANGNHSEDREAIENCIAAQLVLIIGTGIVVAVYSFGDSQRSRVGGSGILAPRQSSNQNAFSEHPGIIKGDRAATQKQSIPIIYSLVVP